MTQDFQAKLQRAGLPRQRFHDSRHAMTTLLMEKGEDIRVVSRLLGHASIRTTSDIYAHLTARMTERAAATMDAIVSRRREAAAIS